MNYASEFAELQVGSETYNAPEVNAVNESIENGFNLNLSEDMLAYDAIKADIFSAITTLFIMFVRCNPFKKASQEDPYFRRLSSQNPEKFWTVFQKKNLPPEFKDLFTKGTDSDPDCRISLQEAL